VNDFYGQSYFAGPDGKIMGKMASDVSDEIFVRDLDLSKLAEARDHWAFYRDRRPDSYHPLVQS
jgi:beta-ureidopropionase